MRDALQEGAVDVEALMQRVEADLVTARTAVRRLETQLSEAKQRATKLEHSLEIARGYAGGSGINQAASQTFSVGRTTVNIVRGAASAVPPTSRATGGASGAAVRAVIDILRARGKPVRTRDLVDELKGASMTFGADPAREVVNLSGYLSRSPELEADRVMGWRLKEWDVVPPEQADTVDQEPAYMRDVPPPVPSEIDGPNWELDPYHDPQNDHVVPSGSEKSGKPIGGNDLDDDILF